MNTIYSVVESLQSNPNNSPTGKAISYAMNALDNGEENWTAILAVCDLVNASEQGPHDAIRSIRKHIQSRPTWPSLSMVLLIIEALVKNCGTRFHIELANGGFLRELRLLLISSSQGTTNNSNDDIILDKIPDDLRKRILGMIQCWAYVFRTNTQLKPVKDLYDELLSKDFVFPDLNESISMIPVQATETTWTNPETTDQTDFMKSAKNLFESVKLNALSLVKGSFFSEKQTKDVQPISPKTSNQSVVYATTFLTSNQIIKLRSEISVVCEHVNILNQIIDSFAPEISANQSTDTNIDQVTQDHTGILENQIRHRKRDIELMDKLYEVCSEMHARILEIIGFVDDELQAQILSLIDEINNVFARYLDLKQEISKNELTAKLNQDLPDIEHDSKLLDLN